MQRSRIIAHTQLQVACEPHQFDAFGHVNEKTHLGNPGLKTFSMSIVAHPFNIESTPFSKIAHLPPAGFNRRGGEGNCT